MANQVVDNNTYNLIMALASNLEALEVYQKYAHDGNAELWNELARQTEESARMLQAELQKAMSVVSTLADKLQANVGDAPRDSRQPNQGDLAQVGASQPI